MKEIYTMWKYNNMVALTVLCAGVYMLFMLPFKSLQFIPGFSEFRPATLFPVLFGLLFGPAGAWGSALGNLAGDFFGTFSIGSIFGFAGNFLYAYIPYKIWRRQKFRHDNDMSPTINSARKLVKFGATSVTSSIACAVVIAWGLDALRLVPFAALSTVISLNNIMITLLLGPIILPVIYRRVKKAGLLYTDIMDPQDISRPNPGKISIFMIYTGALGGFVSGLVISLVFTGQVMVGSSLSTSGSGSLIVEIGVLPFLVVLLYGAFNS